MKKNKLEEEERQWNQSLLRWSAVTAIKHRVRWAAPDSIHCFESSAPAGFVEEMEELVKGEAGAVGEAGLVDLILWGFEGPVDEEWPADEVGAGDQAPVATVEAIGTVVSHDEEVVWRNDEVFALEV